MSYPDVADLDAVNDAVNKLPYKTDIENFEFDEWWARISEKGSGDCEDFALEKLFRLNQSYGWPIESLRLATVMVERTMRENHGILVVATTPIGAEYILDQRQNGLCSLNDLDAVGYTPVRIQKDGGSRSWKEWIWTP